MLRGSQKVVPNSIKNRKGSRDNEISKKSDRGDLSFRIN
jgi:hypothetical protein